MPGWRLRHAGRGDAPRLAMVAAASFLETFAGILSGDDIVTHCARNSSAEKFAGWVDDPASIVTIAEHEQGSAPLGYTLLTTPDLPIPAEAADVELRRIYVLAPTLGTGLGTALMDRVLDDARIAGHARVLLGVHERNGRARAFYERSGFALAGRRRFLVGETWHDDVVYARAV